VRHHPHDATTHAIINANLAQAPMYSGQIEGAGPRYCPSIEDKVVRFADRSQPPDLPRAEEASTTTRSTRTASRHRCPKTFSSRLLKTIPGLEHVSDDPPGLCASSTTTSIRANSSRRWSSAASPAFLAGQINGTTG
jgi:tRNA uridine 5-carboxymethylaminomethyl modification enzyme